MARLSAAASEGSQRVRPRSLAVRALLVTLLVAIAPMVFVWISNLTDATVGERMLDETHEATRRAADVLDRPDAASELDRIARTSSVRLRVLDPDGQVVHDHDHEGGSGLLYLLGSLFFEPDDAPSMAHWDLSQDALEDRIEVAMARASGADQGCTHSAEEKLYVCFSARAVQGEGGPRIVHAQESSRRAIRALYDLRYQLAKLTLFQLLFASALGAWLGWRMVGPVEVLRKQVLDRTRPRVSTQPVDLDRDDEIGDLAGAFNELLGALDARNAAYQSFVEDLAHELKNPVAAIRAASERMDGPLDAQRSARLGRVLRSSSQRLDDLVTEFLELARAEAGLKDAERVPVDLAELASGLIDAMRQDERHERLHLELRGEARMPSVGASSQLEAALRNLLDNAAVFAEGRVRVSVEGRVLVVEDDGPGVARDDRERVFERFHTSRQGKGGTGLGLPLARAVVEAHGGGLICTDPGDLGGARFELHLPLPPRS